MNEYSYIKLIVKHDGCWSAFSGSNYFDTLINIDYSNFNILKANRIAIIRGSKDDSRIQIKYMLNNDKSIIDYEISEILARNRYFIYLISMLQSADNTVINKLRISNVLFFSTNIRDGKEFYDIIGTKAIKSTLNDTLKDNRTEILDLTYEYVDEEKLIKILSRNVMNMLLTEKEQLIIRKAKELGYFDIPRRKNLEELADQLGVSKMNISLSLRKILKKISNFI
ncbi:helix-turn-helix domain-containing protein [Saccharolobus shibatae]|uniref:HTH bat-type domain-containing protein n=1 Tax=Saccharolobus shibatae TaxID=2286 RepID=A0A8F5BYW0_9CREN|nr:helix-turn-helix domain-containing protein [Saccharolobus shibatae]QXJ33911.1 hypothetical protein J5U22_00456 [Saccharolobus shibatae]